MASMFLRIENKTKPNSRQIQKTFISVQKTEDDHKSIDNVFTIERLAPLCNQPFCLTIALLSNCCTSISGQGQEKGLKITGFAFGTLYNFMEF